MRCGGGAAGCGKLHADTTDGAGRQVAMRGDRRQAAGRQEATPPLSRPPGRRPWEDGRRPPAPAHAEETGLVDMEPGARCC